MKFTTTGSSALVAEYTDNGDQLATARWDLTRSGGGAPDGTLESYDPVYCDGYTPARQRVLEYRYAGGGSGTESCRV